ncbi:coiled-coil domain-containing protein [Pedobacter chitinilyticus]|uniref:Beta-carotene 15,15'-monooxygenase n=1 Tax=Pedobacter chitinilyticus TaxID=2233776 RepID=A0A443YM90_9SPHI|nr:beta-carotene 15,15'-monooxygenase [Pedobacter chitinilyticus]RWU04882.1 beta-carotene 15,15'-monooxygenase [Pedobacter chitinilyticus]
MTTQIKNIFRLKSILPTTTSNEKPEINTEEVEEARRRTYHETGFRDSSRNMGTSQVLSICLDAIYAKFQNEEKLLVDKQRQAKEPYINEQKNKETEIKALTVSKENKEEQITRLNDNIKTVKENIESLKFEINDLPRNPEAYHVKAEKGATTKFWVGLIILIPITLYLFTFYVSTSYSAFFKTFDPESNLMANVLDPKAFEKAWADGPLEGAFVMLIPFVFLGLGYLIHMYSENKSVANYFKIGILFLTTFVFDAILAYQIEEKIYELNKTFESAPFDLAIAFTKIQFWGIIFAGFVVYVIWGLVFDFIMKEHKEKDRIKHQQHKRQQDILIHQEKINDFNKEKDTLIKELDSIKELIAKAHGRIAELQRIIDAVIIPTKEYALYASEYVQGWVTFITEKLFVSRTENQNLVKECMEVYNGHCESVGATADSQNSVYLSVV